MFWRTFALSSEITGQRDRLYALLALQNDPSLTPRFKAEYTISTTQAYIVFFAALGQTTGLFEYSGSTRDSENSGMLS